MTWKKSDIKWNPVTDQARRLKPSARLPSCPNPIPETRTHHDHNQLLTVLIQLQPKKETNSPPPSHHSSAKLRLTGKNWLSLFIVSSRRVNAITFTIPTYFSSPPRIPNSPWPLPAQNLVTVLAHFWKEYQSSHSSLPLICPWNSHSPCSSFCDINGSSSRMRRTCERTDEWVKEKHKRLVESGYSSTITPQHKWIYRCERSELNKESKDSALEFHILDQNHCGFSCATKQRRGAICNVFSMTSQKYNTNNSVVSWNLWYIRKWIKRMNVSTVIKSTVSPQ